MQRRAELVLLLEEQGRQAQGLYDAIDAKIEMFDERTQNIQVRCMRRPRVCMVGCVRVCVCDVCNPQT